MASNFLSRSVAMKVDILLVNSNFWLAYGKEQTKATTPLEAFLELVSEGSPEMEAILLKSTCPYLFKIWSQPLFRVEIAHEIERPSQANATVLRSLDETMLGQIFSYLAEEDLARSVSRVCVRFRCSIASKNHVDVLLGKAMSSDLREVFARAQTIRSSAADLADRLVDLSEVLGDAKVQYNAADRDALNGPTPTKADSAIISIFAKVPDCARRLDQLALALTAKFSLDSQKTRVQSILASRTTFMELSSPGRQALLHLLGAVQAYGQTFGSKPRHPSFNFEEGGGASRQGGRLERQAEEDDDGTVLPTWNGFTFASLKDLPEIRSRFHRPFTPAVAVLLHILEQHRDMSLKDLKRGLKEIESCLITLCGATNAPVFHVLAQASNVVEHIRAKGKVVRSAESDSPFHQRLSHLFQLLEPACRDLEAMIKTVHHDLRALMMWLFPERADSEEQSLIVKVYGADGELKCLFDFVQHCLSLLSKSSAEGCAAIRELAIATTALESAAVAKNASQKGLARQNSAPAGPASEDFTRARSAVARTLNSAENVKEERKERMSQILREVLSEDEQERRRVELQRTLQLRLPGQPLVNVEATAQDEEEEEQGDRVDGNQEEEMVQGDVERVEDIDVEEEEDNIREGERDSGSPILEEAVASPALKVEVADESSTALLVRSPQSIVASSTLRGAEPSNMPALSLADFKTTKLWNWITFSTMQEPNIWSELALGKDEFVVPMGEEEERVLQKLFSRGPEVAFTVSQTHQKLKHFTSEDFSGMRSTRSSLKRDQSESLLDTSRTLKAVESIPVVAKVRELALSPSATAGASASIVTSPSAMAVDKQQRREEEEEEDENAAAGLVLPLVRVLELKKQGKLASIRLKPNQLEAYLDDDEFLTVFKMPRAEFVKLAGWKRDKLKKEVGLF